MWSPITTQHLAFGPLFYTMIITVVKSPKHLFWVQLYKFTQDRLERSVIWAMLNSALTKKNKSSDKGK